METVHDIEKLLETLPETWDADKLDALLLEHVATISQYARAHKVYWEVTPLLENFVKEASISYKDLHDSSRYLTIQFSQEGVPFRQSILPGIQYEISPRDVIKSIVRALEIVKEGLGPDPYMDVTFRSTLALITEKYMTLDWGEPCHLFPAFRYEREREVTPGNIEGIVKTIKEGRSRVQGVNSQTGGVVKAGIH